MTTFLPMTKASLGLSITRDSLCLVEVRRQWNRVVCRRISESLLPPGCLRLSPAQPNIENMKDFIDCLRAVVKHNCLPQSVALSLPDICGRTTILSFPSFPVKQSEQDSVIRWRFQQDMNVMTDKTRFTYRTVAASTHQTHPRHVLATAVQLDIIEQYEDACLAVGLLPNSVGLSGLDVCDFYQAHIPPFGRQSKHQSRSINQEFLFLYLANWGFSFMAFRNAAPIFLRVKTLPIPRFSQNTPPPDQTIAEPDEDTQNSVSPQIDNGQHLQHYTSTHLNTVSNELVATLQYYFEAHQYERSDNAPIPFYFAEGLCHGEELFPAEDSIENMLNATILRPPPLSIMKVADTLPPKTKVAIMKASSQMNSISALASVAVA